MERGECGRTCAGKKSWEKKVRRREGGKEKGEEKKKKKEKECVVTDGVKVCLAARAQ